MTTANPLKYNGSASNAIPSSIENMENEIQRLKSINNELVAALPEMIAMAEAWQSTDGEPATEFVRRLKALARAESAAPAKHPDTVRLEHVVRNLTPYDFVSMPEDFGQAREFIDSLIATMKGGK